jgi:prepilin-type N-terminal cleavage/methylation domain-containing protein
VRRPGFTLVEVMVVVVVASLIGLGVAGTVSVALDTRQRVEARRLEVRGALAWRGLVIEALRNARPPAVPGDTALMLLDGEGPGGEPRDRLLVLTSGSLPPLYSGTDWVVSVGAQGEGVGLMAAPVGVRAVPVQVRPPEAVTGMSIEVRETPGGPWLSEWYHPLTMPAAVRIELIRADGSVEPPLTVRLPALDPLQ